MAWFAALTFAAISIGAAVFVYTLTSNLEPQPEYSPVMTRVLRALGLVIVAGGCFFGLVLLVYAIRASLGW